MLQDEFSNDTELQILLFWFCHSVHKYGGLALLSWASFPSALLSGPFPSFFPF